MKHRFFIPEPLPGVSLAPWFTPLPEGALFKEGYVANFFDTIERCTPEQAAAIILPNNFKVVDERIRAYIARYAELGTRLSIPVYVFSLGDFTDSVQFDERVRVFRLSLYASTRSPRDISMPTMTEDIGKEHFIIREKAATPTVSFCGMAAFATSARWVRYWLKNVLLPPSRRIGVYWRRASMRACSNSSLVNTLFIVRRSFSGHQQSIELDPARARQEFIDTMRNSDFVLASKGDGNYSNRFLEALSMGRIPVVVDTDIVLPFEGVIDYSRFMVRVPMHDVSKTPQYIRTFYDALSPQEWVARQYEAREVFLRYLQPYTFFEELFTRAAVIE